MAGENWSALSIWIDEHISNPIAMHGSSKVVALIFLIFWYWAMDDFLKAAVAYMHRKKQR